MGYYPSLNERKQRIIENACDSCGGGDDGAAASSGDDGGIENDNDQLLKGLRILRKKKKPAIDAK